jgi:hypothetical protein
MSQELVGNERSAKMLDAFFDRPAYDLMVASALEKWSVHSKDKL